MFSTSGDILNLVLAVAIAALTGFLVYAIYYFIVSIKKIHNLISKIDSGVSKTQEILSLIKSKIKGGSAYLMLFGELAKHLMKLAKDNNWSKEKKDKEEKRKKGKK